VYATTYEKLCREHNAILGYVRYNTDMNESLISWKTHEFIYRKKGSDWYWVLGIIAIAGTLIAILIKNILFAILIVVGAINIGIYAMKKPRKIACEVTDHGLKIDKVFYQYDVLESFWIDTINERIPTLLIVPKKTLATTIIIPLEGVEPEEVRANLESFLPEVKVGKSIVDRLSSWVGF
jgi:hypothetical protein